MPSLEEIMAGKGRSAESESTEPTTEGTEVQATEGAPQDPGPEAAAQEPAPEDESGEPQPDESGKVPLAAVQREREKRNKRYTEAVQDFERKLDEQNKAWESKFTDLLTRLATQQAPQQPQPAAPEQPIPELWDDPTGWLKANAQKEFGSVFTDVAQLRESVSEMRARQAHGNEAVDAAFNSLKALSDRNDPQGFQVWQAIRQSPDPYGSLVNWHQSQPEAMEARLRAKIMEELKITPQSPGASAPSAAAPGAPRPTGPMPGNFANAPAGVTRAAGAGNNGRTLQDIMKR